MIRLIDNYDLLEYNTFNLKAKTKRFFEFTESEELLEFLDFENLPEKYLIMGGGSNILFRNDFDGLVIYPNIPGIVEESEDRNYVYLEAGAGVEWDELVRLSVTYGFGGLENLSLIPGHVGASPVQNIGAFGAEAKDRIYLVRGVNLQTRKRVEFTNEECNFGYRDSIFKNELKNSVVVTSVVYKLDKFPEFKLEYGALKTEVEKLGDVSLQNIRQAVVNIRESKLPNPQKMGNAGSFFKNPIVEKSIADKLKSENERMPYYPIDDKNVKLAAGWLIDQCGLKGFTADNCGIHKNQALVIVNYGGATGADLVALAKHVQNSVKQKFSIELEPEVNFI